MYLKKEDIEKIEKTLMKEKVIEDVVWLVFLVIRILGYVCLSEAALSYYLID